VADRQASRRSRRRDLTKRLTLCPKN
jgi:hypothetical protein